MGFFTGFFIVFRLFLSLSGTDKFSLCKMDPSPNSGGRRQISMGLGSWLPCDIDRSLAMAGPVIDDLAINNGDVL